MQDAKNVHYKYKHWQTKNDENTINKDGWSIWNLTPENTLTYLQFYFYSFRNIKENSLSIYLTSSEGLTPLSGKVVSEITLDTLSLFSKDTSSCLPL